MKKQSPIGLLFSAVGGVAMFWGIIAGHPFVVIISLLVISVVVIIAVIYSSYSYKQKGVSANTTLLSNNVDSMSGIEFERYCAQLLVKNGFAHVSFTRINGDHGADILAYKNGAKYAVQCKCYGRNVGNKAVQEILSGKIYYRANIAVVMTNSYFTKQAKSDAKRLDVQLWDRTTIGNM